MGKKEFLVTTAILIGIQLLGHNVVPPVFYSVILYVYFDIPGILRELMVSAVFTSIFGGLAFIFYWIIVIRYFCCKHKFNTFLFWVFMAFWIGDFIPSVIWFSKSPNSFRLADNLLHQKDVFVDSNLQKMYRSVVAYVTDPTVAQFERYRRIYVLDELDQRFIWRTGVDFDCDQGTNAQFIALGECVSPYIQLLAIMILQVVTFILIGIAVFLFWSGKWSFHDDDIDIDANPLQDPAEFQMNKDESVPPITYYSEV